MPTHSETRALPYTAQQMYDLVADVASYPKFLPWCSAARIRSVTPQGASSVMEADLVISFKVFRERFGSRVVLHPDDMKIDTEYLDGPFRYMKSNWAFRDTDQGCEVEFFVDFEFKNMVLQGIIGVVFNEAMQRIVRAFETRAADLYDYDEAAAIIRHDRPLNTGEIGCYLSHIKALRMFLAGEAACAVVLEDDIDIPTQELFENLKAIAAKLDEFYGDKWDCVNFGSAQRPGFQDVAFIENGIEVRRSTFLPVSLPGVMWTRAGAEAYLNSIFGHKIRGPEIGFVDRT